MKNRSISSYISLLVVFLLVIGVFTRYLYRTPRYVNGEKAENIVAPLPSGDTVALFDIKNKYILLDFWGSWCSPCLEEVPGLVQLYDTYHTKRFTEGDGFEIFSIGIESDREKWFQTIQNEGMKWKYHVTDLQNFDSPIVALYGVRSIPAKFLIDPQGTIIGVNQSLEEINKILAEKVRPD